MLAALEKTLNYPLHAAAGIILLVVAVEVMPAALRSAPAWLFSLAFMEGGCAYLLMESGVKRLQGRKQG
ncbi:MAG: hypothetical protein WBB23_26290 [Desulforhopalus sp.]